MKKAIFCWSGGKDSAYALYKVVLEKEFEIVSLLTTINSEFGRITMHGVKESLLDAQVEAIGLPVKKMYISDGTYTEYESEMEKALLEFKEEGVEHVIFGDIFLEDLRKYREDNLKKVDMKAVFPLWNINTREQIQQFIEDGFKTKICCVNDSLLDKNFVGVNLTQEFLDALPKQVDPCGENGEFHSFCYAGPIFRTKIDIEVTDKVYKPIDIPEEEKCQLTDIPPTKGFWYAELDIKA